ncbi:hypothetical protein [Sphingobium sp.]|uniref:hypothetical protein n=1 Tax=Sphingobium sp. TaxID=1912891 RepID=UPI0028BDC3A2|nr:hypothetical protein [Sphingobium sp.]
MGVQIFVPDIPEFTPLLDGARKTGGCTVEAPRSGYWTIKSENELRFERRALGLGPALWNSALCGGFQGRIEEYGRDVLRIVSDD